MKHLIKRIVPGLLAAVLLAGTVPAYAEEDGTRFRDVSANAYYADAVEWAVTEGVTNGTSGSTFSPGSTVTRAQAVTFLWRAAGQPEPSASAPTFTDAADRNSYYYQAVRWAAEEGITNGVTATTFQPDGTLHYDQILAFLCRAAGGNATGSGWSQKAQTWAAANGITDGLTYAAKGNCPRSDAVYFLWQQSEGDTERTEEEQERTEEEQTKEEQQAQEQQNQQGQTSSPAGELSTGLLHADGAEAAIIDGFLRRTASISLSPYGLTADEALELAQSIADINGRNIYRVKSISCAQSGSAQARALTVTYPQDTMFVIPNTDEDARAIAEAVVDDLIRPGMSDYDIALTLHDYLVLHCEYNSARYGTGIRHMAHDAFGALAIGDAVCEGYALAYEMLMETAGIPCEYVSGYANGAHGWNIVQIDGAWYHVDTTWDDPLNMSRDYVRYDYFLKSDSYMRRDHSRWTASHACTSTKYDGVDLPDTEEQEEEQQEQEQQQEQQQKQEQFDAIRRILDDAIADLPFRTEAEWEGMTSDELNAYRNAYVTLDDSYSNLTLQEAYQAMADDLRVQYPDLSIYYDREHHGYRIYRNDLVAAIKEIQAEENAARQEERDRRVAEIVAQIQDAIRAGLDTCRFEGEYTFSEVGAAYREMNEKGYTFDDYAAREDYWFGGYNAYLVNIVYPSN